MVRRDSFMTDGKIILNGLTDPQYQIIVEQTVNGPYRTAVRFDEGQMQTEHGALVPGGRNQPPYYAGNPIYNNVILLWNGDDGLKAIAAIIALLSQ
jgi:hypothetical protein